MKTKTLPNWKEIDALRANLGLVCDAPQCSRTVNDWATLYGMSRPGAAHQLWQLVSRGALKAGWTMRNGRRVRAYWPAS